MELDASEAPGNQVAAIEEGSQQQPEDVIDLVPSDDEAAAAVALPTRSTTPARLGVGLSLATEEELAEGLPADDDEGSACEDRPSTPEVDTDVRREETPSLSADEVGRIFAKVRERQRDRSRGRAPR